MGPALSPEHLHKSLPRHARAESPLRRQQFQASVGHTEQNQGQHDPSAVFRQHPPQPHLPTGIQEQISRYHQKYRHAPAHQIHDCQEDPVLLRIQAHIRGIHDAGGGMEHHHRQGCHHPQSIQKSLTFSHLFAAFLRNFLMSQHCTPRNRHAQAYNEILRNGFPTSRRLQLLNNIFMPNALPPVVKNYIIEVRQDSSTVSNKHT